jgi:hypothetical protein
MVPYFDPAGTGDVYAVAITDPDLIYKQQLEQGLESYIATSEYRARMFGVPSGLRAWPALGGSVTMPVAIPKTGSVRILARVRGLSALERSTYTTGWPLSGEAASGAFTLRVDEKNVGAIPVEGFPWRWVALDAGPVPLAAGVVVLEVATRDAGIAVDNILVTNDPDFVPQGRGQVPEDLSAAPEGLRAEPLGVEDERAVSEPDKEQAPRVKLAWHPVAAPQGVSHYNVYRSDNEAFEAEPETLLGSPNGPVFYDVGLEAGRTVYYRVRAVDAWGNQSPASAALAVAPR